MDDSVFFMRRRTTSVSDRIGPARRFASLPREGGRRYSASRRTPPSQAVTTSSATAPGGSSLTPTSVQVG